MNADWQLFQNALTPAECNRVIKYAQRNYDLQPATVGHGGSSRIDPKLRTSQIRWLDRADVELYWLFARVERMALQANANAFGFDLSGFCEIQFTEYHGANADHYDWHQDNNWRIQKPFDRKLSMVMNLSDPNGYDGGMLELRGDPIHENFRNQGSAIFFPSFLWHKANPVTRGTRYSLVTWIQGPHFR